MKANKFAIEQDDQAVSPVIAVILMVAITVVLAATVYVWVSGFGTSGQLKAFPQVTMQDSDYAAPASLTAGVGSADNAALAVLEHRGGDSFNWADYTINAFNDGTATSGDFAVDYGTAVDGSSLCTGTTTASPATAFTVGNKLYVCVNSASSDWIDGEELTIQIIDENQNAIVYESDVIIA